MASNINLDGGEISIIKALGMSGGEITGEEVLRRVPELVAAEVIDSLKVLVQMGYVVTDTPSFNKLDDLEKARFYVNSGYARELKDAMDPTPERPKSRRIRRE